MNCAKYLEWADAWVDGELSVRSRDELEAHLDSCGGCRGTFSQRADFLRKFRHSMRSVAVPAEVRKRILGLAARRDTDGPIRSRRHGWAVAAAAVFLVSIIAVSVRAYHRQGQVEWCRAFIDDHMENVLLGGGGLQSVSRSPEELGRWFSRELGYPVSLPELEGADLKGGRMCILKGSVVALAVYDLGPRKVSLFVAPEKAIRVSGWNLDGGSYHTVSEGGYSLAAWRREGYLNVLVSDFPEEQLSRLARRGT